MPGRIISLWLVLITFLGGAFSCYRPKKTADLVSNYHTVERDMEKYRGISSYVARCGGVPTLFVNGAPFPAAAYMTYLEEYNNYSQFAEAGCRLFSVPVLFAGRWINAAFNNKPFHNGIFDNKNGPDFSALDGSVQKILDSCPDALIFPRLNVSMPLWWIEENVDCLDGMGQRESLYSQKFRDTACDMLRQVIRHINRSAYASHIVGYQIAGGNTEEWFHFDLNAGFSETAEKAFDEYLRKYYPDCGFSGLPDMSLLKGKNTYHRDERLALFLEFASFAAADDICLLCSVAKEETGGNVVVGTFYGYSLEVSSPLYGTHSLKTLLACDAVDFICSPNSYIGTRDPGADWTEMYPADSVRLHGKLCMQECDVRTHLTRPLSECAPEYDENASYTAPIWQPLESRELSVSMLRKTFARQLIKGNGFWWFDMWGGWYNDPVILSDIEKMIDICSSSLFARNRASKAETAVFIDESAYKYYTDCAMRNAAFNQRMELGLSGAPYDIYDLSDFEAVYKNYKCVVFLSSLKTTYMARALELCKKDRVKYISLSAYKTKFSSKELRAFMKECGAHIYISSDDIVYVNESFIAVHSRSEGAKTIDLGGLYSYRELLSDGEMSGMSDTITLYMKKNETRLFSLASENSSIY